jgi:hypothetical protein
MKNSMLRWYKGRAWLALGTGVSSLSQQTTVQESRNGFIIFLPFFNPRPQRGLSHTIGGKRLERKHETAQFSNGVEHGDGVRVTCELPKYGSGGANVKGFTE